MQNTLILMLSSLWFVRACNIECTKVNSYLCADKNILPNDFVEQIDGVVRMLYTTCSNEAMRMGSDRPKIGITLAECNSSTFNREESIETNNKIWMTDECRVDHQLMLLIIDGAIVPLISMRRNSIFRSALPTVYNKSSLNEVAEISLLKMEEANRSKFAKNEELFEPSQDNRNHWPTWAIILVIVCIILTALAFLLGNFITRKSTSLRYKNPTAGPKRERKWGAGFSGGLWAAA